eukprot:1160014-Pelagomonas_calceolata.AAC.8
MVFRLSNIATALSTTQPVAALQSQQHDAHCQHEVRPGCAAVRLVLQTTLTASLKHFVMLCFAQSSLQPCAVAWCSLLA